MSTRTWTLGRSVFFTGVALAAALLVDQIIGCMSAPAQMRVSTSAAVNVGAEVPATPDDLIVQMSQSAGVIFVGHAVEVRQPSGFSGSPEAASEGIVEVDFFVDQAVRGPAQGSRYTLREWGGLWAAGTERYRIGQRLLLLLHAPDSAGLGSPVHGAEGLIPLSGAGQPPGPDDDASTPPQWTVDVRWLQAQTLRIQSLRLGMPVRGRIPILGGRGPHSEVSGAGHSLVPQNVSRSNDPSLVYALPGPWIEQQSSTVQTEALVHVLDLCTGSTGSQDASK